MPIPLPELDDRTYAELTAEARSLIPHLLPSWTDHNPSDPGMVLVELLAWLTEMLLFQVNEIPEASTEGFLKLLNGRDWQRRPGTGIDEAVQATMLDLRRRHRAVTTDDYEHLCLRDWSATSAAVALGDPGIVARVRAVPRRNLDTDDPAVREDPAPGHVTLVVVPRGGGGDDDRHPLPTDRLRQLLVDFFAPRNMLTTKLHVAGPTYVDVAVTATLALHEGATPAVVFADVRRALAALFDPLTGGPDGRGWPFGRDVHASEVFAVVEKVPLVNYIEDVTLARGSADGDGDGDGEPDGPGAAATGRIRPEDDELVRLTTVGLVAFDPGGKRHPERGADVAPAVVPPAPAVVPLTPVAVAPAPPVPVEPDAPAAPDAPGGPAPVVPGGGG